MEKMTPEVKAAWVAALRSGEYKQGTNALQRGEQFCCLGVLCDIAVKQFEIQLEVAEDYCCDDCTPKGGASNKIAYDGSTSFLPYKVRQWANLTDDGQVSGTHPYRNESDMERFTDRLYVLNDNGYSFAEIADIIEQEL